MNDPSQSHGECLLMSDESAFGEAMAIDNSSDASRLQFQALTAVAQISIAILAHDTFRWNKRSLETSPVCNRSSNFKCRGFATGDGAIERHFFRVWSRPRASLLFLNRLLNIHDTLFRFLKRCLAVVAHRRNPILRTFLQWRS
ncbi:hypothetical protein [Paraburkholderia sp.]|uniref:hypothetical protein n=1 Tax=Paraburkholderia sp. TaxID=1926495 RepID=UPI002AFF9EC5|nr:hypothetical protein [Paraburkholderia sp.]